MFDELEEAVEVRFVLRAFDGVIEEGIDIFELLHGEGAIIRVGGIGDEEGGRILDVVKEGIGVLDFIGPLRFADIKDNIVEGQVGTLDVLMAADGFQSIVINARFIHEGADELLEDGEFIEVIEFFLARQMEDVRIVEVKQSAADGIGVNGRDFDVIADQRFVLKKRVKHRDLVDFRRIEGHREIRGRVTRGREVAVAIMIIIGEIEIRVLEVDASVADFVEGGGIDQRVIETIRDAIAI